MNPLKNPLKKLLTLTLLGLPLVASIPNIKPAKAQFIPTSNYDLVGYDGVSQGTLTAPDFSNLNFNSLGSFPQSGFIPSDYDHLAGYSLGRTWQAGDRIVDILKLGDVADGFGVGRFTLEDIASKSGNYGQVPLSNYGFLQHQTVASFIAANPQLNDIPIKQVLPLADLVTQFYGYQGQVLLDFPVRVLVDEDKISLYQELNLNKTIEVASLDPFSLIAQTNEAPVNPTLNISDIELGELDLSNYTLADVEGLGTSYIEQYEQWQEGALSSIEGLGEISFDQFPDPAEINLSFVSRIDWIWGYEHGLVTETQSISGSDQAGYDEPCDIECAHLELDDLENAGRDIRLSSEGGRWLVGQDPGGIFCPEPPWGVEGGFGILGIFNCGRESTGRNPFGDQFKVVLWSVDEVAETAETALFFRICKRGIPDLGCTPYFIGPVPFLPVSRGGWIITGSD